MTFTKNSFTHFLIVFAAIFIFCYFGALFITGVSIKGGLYSPFIEQYFNLSAWLRSSLIVATKFFVSIFNIQAVRTSDYVLRVPTANGIRIVYSCLGFGVMSFWIAYIVATAAKIKKKIIWLIVGLFLIWFINVSRISMVLISGNRGWKFPLGLDHHTWFNIVAYLAIFTMMFFFEKSIKKTYLNEG